jgi:branched-chain amino acid transport system ATP-binding protein
MMRMDDGAILSTEHLTKRFGGLTAVGGVSLALHVGQVHAVIGPNGAGKTTLANLLSGDLAPTSGSIHYEGRNLAGMPADSISRLGIGRSYQKTNIFGAFTVFENCRLAAQSRTPHAWRVFRGASRFPHINSRAGRALEMVGLESRRDVLASALSHGEQRQLEIAMCLATQPRVLVLDEPLAGMGSSESARVVELIAALARDHAVMLIEHDMDAVFAVAHRLTVMVSGEVLESGEPAAVRASRTVQQAYLGEATSVLGDVHG